MHHAPRMPNIWSTSTIFSALLPRFSPSTRSNASIFFQSSYETTRLPSPCSSSGGGPESGVGFRGPGAPLCEGAER